MAHNINEERMFYVGEKPWHGIGVKLDQPATSAEAIKASRLDIPVSKKPLFIMDDNQFLPKEVDLKVATVREDTNEVLGIVGPNYQIVQNIDAFSFFDSVVGEGQAIYHTAGALGRGERIWLMAKLPDDIAITNSDIVEKYLILTNSHDGTSCLKMYFSPIRVVCQNTLNMSLRNAQNCVNIRHSGDIRSKKEVARKSLGIALKYYDTFKEISQYMAKTSLSSAELSKYFDKVLDIKDAKESPAVVLNQKDELTQLFEKGMGNNLPGVRGTLWAGYNAITEYVDHHKTVKRQDEDPTNRLKSIWFGAGAELKEKAFETAYQMIGGSI